MATRRAAERPKPAQKEDFIPSLVSSTEGQMAVEGFLRNVQADEHYRKYVKIVDLITNRVDPQADRKELVSLLNGRSSRTLKEKKFSPTAIARAAAEDMAARSRLTMLRLRATYNYDILKDALKALGDYVRTAYPAAFNLAKTEAQKQALIHRVQRDGLELLTRLDSLISAFDAVTKDIDETRPHLRIITDTLSMVTDRE